MSWKLLGKTLGETVVTALSLMAAIGWAAEATVDAIDEALERGFNKLEGRDPMKRRA